MNKIKREEYLKHMVATATPEEYQGMEEIKEILRTVSVSTLLDFMVNHPEYEASSMRTLERYMQYFPESSFMEAAVYTAAGYYHKHHKMQSLSQTI